MKSLADSSCCRKFTSSSLIVAVPWYKQRLTSVGELVFALYVFEYDFGMNILMKQLHLNVHVL